MNHLITACILFGVIVIFLTVIFFYERKTLMAIWLQEKAMWNEERQKLLDRIQAPSFETLKHTEVIKIKAEKEGKEPENFIEEV